MALRRNARLRREYLYKKSLEGKAKEEYERKERLRTAITEGKPIPTELRRDAEALKKEIDLEDNYTAKPRSTIDDEYANAGIRDPKVCITTSRDPSSRLRQFASEVRFLFPNSQRINRGNTTTKEILEAARLSDFTDIILLQETRGEPDAMLISHLPYGPTVHFSLSNTVLRHDLDSKIMNPISEQYPHLIFHNFQTALGTRITNILKHLFPVPKEESTRVITFANDNDYISFRHHTYVKNNTFQNNDKNSTTTKKTKDDDIVLTEIGPRFELHPFQVKLGTLDQTDAESEWVLRPFMNTARKHNAL